MSKYTLTWGENEVDEVDTFNSALQRVFDTVKVNESIKITKIEDKGNDTLFYMNNDCDVLCWITKIESEA